MIGIAIGAAEGYGDHVAQRIEHQQGNHAQQRINQHIRPIKLTNHLLPRLSQNKLLSPTLREIKLLVIIRMNPTTDWNMPTAAE